MKPTAVNWLIEQIKSDRNQKALCAFEWMQVINHAKQMEQEHMIELIQFVRTHNKVGKSVDDLFYEYYNETYGDSSAMDI